MTIYFKGFNDWVEIFSGGKQIDSAGKEHDGTTLINRAIETFSAGAHEPPIVLGHPTDNAPAYGWVQELKKTGNTLLAKFKDVVPEFASAVEKGMYKKRSASFYPDGRLRHVGFLGAMPPAVKGLADLVFNDNDDSIVFDFNETKKNKTDKTKKEKGMTFAEFAEMFKFWKEETGFPGPQVQKNDKSFSEPDDINASTAWVKTAMKEAAAKERKKVEKEFAEKAIKAKQDAKKKDISNWVEQGVKEGKILPLWAKSGLQEFMGGLDVGAEIEFADGAEKKTPLEFFKGMLLDLEKSPMFTEIARAEKAGESGDFAEAKKDQEMGASIAAKVNPVKITD